MSVWGRSARSRPTPWGTILDVFTLGWRRWLTLLLMSISAVAAALVADAYGAGPVLRGLASGLALLLTLLVARHLPRVDRQDQ